MLSLLLSLDRFKTTFFPTLKPWYLLPKSLIGSSWFHHHQTMLNLEVTPLHMDHYIKSWEGTKYIKMLTAKVGNLKIPSLTILYRMILMITS